MEAGGITEKGRRDGEREETTRKWKGMRWTEREQTGRANQRKRAVRRSDRKEDSIIRHQQSYLIAIGFSLPKASAGFMKIVFIRRLL
jgi:hypothetical protein